MTRTEVPPVPGCPFRKILAIPTYRSLGEYNINEHGFQKRSAGPVESDSDEKAYRCASHEMHIFGPIGNGASSVVERAIFIPVHRILALKKINIFEKIHLEANLVH
jgi:hypothetical protein